MEKIKLNFCDCKRQVTVTKINENLYVILFMSPWCFHDVAVEIKLIDNHHHHIKSWSWSRHCTKLSHICDSYCIL